MGVIVLAEGNLLDDANCSGTNRPLAEGALAIMVSRARLTLTILDTAHFTKSALARPRKALVVLYMNAICILLASRR